MTIDLDELGHGIELVEFYDSVDPKNGPASALRASVLNAARLYLEQQRALTDDKRKALDAIYTGEDSIGWWMSAALEDEKVCDEMKQSIIRFFEVEQTIRASLSQPSSDNWNYDMSSAPLNKSVLIYIQNAEHYGDGIYPGLQVDVGTGKIWTVTGLSMGRDCGIYFQPIAWQPLPAGPTPPNTEE